MRTRGFTVREAMIGIAILLVVLACTYPYVASASARAKTNRCQERLHALSIALALYRTDHEGAPMSYAEAETKGPWSSWYPLSGYLPAPRVTRCPDPSWSIRHPFDLYAYRAIPALSNPGFFHGLASIPGGVVAFCRNHTDPMRVRGVPRSADLYQGRYPVVREDGSSASYLGSHIEVWGLDEKGWHQKPADGMSLVWRFPKEPWPPKIEE